MIVVEPELTALTVSNATYQGVEAGSYVHYIVVVSNSANSLAPSYRVCDALNICPVLKLMLGEGQ